MWKEQLQQPDKDVAGGQKDTDNTKNTSQNGPPRLTEQGGREVGRVRGKEEGRLQKGKSSQRWLTLAVMGTK